MYFFQRITASLGDKLDCEASSGSLNVYQLYEQISGQDRQQTRTLVAFCFLTASDKFSILLDPHCIGINCRDGIIAVGGTGLQL